MNYLAHAYLSFGQPGVLTGNMISDFVKGKKKFDYPAEIRRGIALHRSIDQFTDTHAATREAKEVFRPAYRLYSGAFVDVVFDHFPEKFARMYPYMRDQNWLFHYRFKPGIEKSFGGLVRRAAYIDESDTAYQLFEDNYQLLQDCFRQFWPELRAFTLEIFKTGVKGI